VEEVAEGVWSIGGYSIANTTLIEGENGLIVYDTGNTREEAEHIRDAVEKISDKGRRPPRSSTARSSWPVASTRGST
jgi:alkyl sulfatase BDS1-like metallo-beta-lactamase superfamily hydrolase